MVAIDKKFGFSILLGVFMLMSFVSVGQSNQECLTDVKAAYAKMNGPLGKWPDRKQGYHLNYTMDVKFAKGSAFESNKSTIDVVVGNQQISIKSEEFESYQDQEVHFMVIHPSKVIYRTGAQEIDKENRMNQIALFQDTLFDMMTVVKCESVIEGEKSLKHVHAQLSSEGRGMTGIKEIHFYLNENSNKISHLKMIFEEYNKQYESIKIIFNELNYDKPIDSTMLKSVSRRFLNGKGELLEKYKGYQLIDLRR